MFDLEQEVYAEVNVDFLRGGSGNVRDFVAASAEKKFKVAVGKGSRRMESDCMLVTFCRKLT